MSQKQFLTLVSLAAIIGATVFYWYAWRPTEIKERCYAEAEFDQRALSEANDNARRNFINGYYDDCIKKFGID